MWGMGGREGQCWDDKNIRLYTSYVNTPLQFIYLGTTVLMCQHLDEGDIHYGQGQQAHSSHE